MLCGGSRRTGAVKQAEARRTRARHAGKPAPWEPHNGAEYIGDLRRDRDGGFLEIVPLGREPGEQCITLGRLAAILVSGEGRDESRGPLELPPPLWERAGVEGRAVGHRCATSPDPHPRPHPTRVRGDG